MRVPRASSSCCAAGDVDCPCGPRGGHPRVTPGTSSRSMKRCKLVCFVHWHLGTLCVCWWRDVDAEVNKRKIWRANVNERTYIFSKTNDAPSRTVTSCRHQQVFFPFDPILYALSNLEKTSFLCAVWQIFMSPIKDRRTSFRLLLFARHASGF